MTVTGLTITCKCGKRETFSGDLLTSVKAAGDSNRWFTNKKGFAICIDCFIWGEDRELEPGTRDRRSEASSY